MHTSPEILMHLYFFGWPSRIGGAGTKLAHLLDLLSPHYDITVVPNRLDQFIDTEWRAWMRARHIRSCSFEELPERLAGWGVALCNGEILANGRIKVIRERGLRMAWSSEMMWHAPGELGTVMLGWVDAVLYVSPVQRQALEPGYLAALRVEDQSVCPAEGDPEALTGTLTAPGKPGTRWVMTGNYINPDCFPFRDRAADSPGRHLVIGRVSRPDPHKFPADFPASWNELGLKNPHFRVLGWSDQMYQVWPREAFDERWELLPAGSVATDEFLQSIDILVYEVHPELSESWGRAIVEAMLCGAIPLIPADRRHHLHRLVPHGTAGFHCASREEFGHCARLLETDPKLRARMSRGARRYAEQVLCNAGEHLALWRMVFAN